MKVVPFHVGHTPGINTVDYHIGRYRLAKHFATSQICALDADPRYARQLLLKEPSSFPSGRVPLFVCECCADLDCGATTVAVDISEDIVTWSHFAQEVPYQEGLFVSEIYARTGPFLFNLAEYRSALLPYTRGR